MKTLTRDFAPPPKVGQAIQKLRHSKQLTLDDLATQSGVSKAILSQIERDLSNPTLSTIWRITQALEMPLEDLLASSDPGSLFEKLPVHSTPEVSNPQGTFRLRILGTLGSVATFQWYHFEAEPQAELISDSHGPGSLESITLSSGAVQVIIEDSRETVVAGETLRYQTDAQHHLISLGPDPAVGFMVNLLRGTQLPQW